MMFFTFFVLNEKAKTEPEVIYPMWVAYFGALFGSAGIFVAAGESGIFAVDGKPQNRTAELILAGANFFLDIGPEFWALIGLLVFFVSTQCFAYIFSGISGSAQSPRFISQAWKWVMLLIAKALISASAIVLSIEIIGRQYYWVSADPRHLAGNVVLAIMLLFVGLWLFCLVPLRGMGTARVDGKIGQYVNKIDRYMRRRLPTSQLSDQRSSAAGNSQATVPSERVS